MLIVSRVFITSLVLLLVICPTYAQEIQLPDSLAKKIDSAFIFKTHRLDSIKKVKDKTIDSVTTINNNISNRINKLKQVVDDPVGTLDTLHLIENRPFQKIDSVKHKLTSKIDSLTSIGLPHDQYSKTLDSLNKINPLNHLQNAKDKIDEAQTNLQEKLNQPAGKINEKLNQLRSEAGGEGNLPGNISARGMNQADLSDNLSDINPEISGSDLSDINANHITKDVNTDVNLNFKDKVHNSGTLDEVSKVQVGLDEASEVTEKISGYTEDARNITSGNFNDIKQIDKDIAAKVEVEEVGVLQEQTQLLENHKDMVRSLRNQEEFKKQTLAKARAMVAQQLASRQSKIAETVNKISKHQKRAGTVFSKVKGLPKRPRKEKKPPVIERFVPGITVQVQKTDTWFVDFNPTLRYRIRSIFSAGAGWNERIAFDKDFNFYKDNRIYGIRSFYELSVLKGLWIRADVERMNAFVPISRTQQDIGERKQVWSYMAGIKKEFSFVPGIIGNVQFMYNLYDRNRTSPYFNRFNVRFGFEFPLKKNTQKEPPHPL